MDAALLRMLVWVGLLVWLVLLVIDNPPADPARRFGRVAPWIPFLVVALLALLFLHPF